MNLMKNQVNKPEIQDFTLVLLTSHSSLCFLVTYYISIEMFILQWTISLQDHILFLACI